MRNFVILAILAFAAPMTFAQPDDHPSPPGEGKGLRGEVGQPGRRGAQAGRPGQGGQGQAIGPMIQRLKQQLQLDDEQAGQFDGIVAKFRDRLGAGRPSADENQGPRMRELMREMRDAREAGDDDRVQELRRELRELRGTAGPQPGGSEGRGGPAGPRPPDGRQLEAFFDEVQGILHEDQIPKLEQARERMRQAMQRRGGPQIRVDELPKRLDLDEEQLQTFHELADELNNKLESMRPSPETRGLMRELREAENAGEDDRAAELRKQLDASRPDPTPAYDTFFAQLSDVLRDDQKAQLAEFRKEAQRPGQGPGGGKLRDLIRAVRQLDLSEDQKRQLKDVTREAMDAERGKEGTVQPDALKEKILKILTPDQAQELERLMKRSRANGPDNAPPPPGKAAKKPGKRPPPPGDDGGR